LWGLLEGIGSSVDRVGLLVGESLLGGLVEITPPVGLLELVILISNII